LNYGACFPLPATCEDEPTNPDCIEECEYFPEQGKLNATIKWQWGHQNMPREFSGKADVWSTPTVARIYDANCDGRVDLADPPNIVFVSADANGANCNKGSGNACRSGVLRVLDGRRGSELFSVAKAFKGSTGFAGISVALGDVDNDQSIEIVALTGEGRFAIVDSRGDVELVGEESVFIDNPKSFGWGGGIALGDMNNDGQVEMAFGGSVFTLKDGKIKLLFHGSAGTGGESSRSLSYFADLDGDGGLELIAGTTAYSYDGSVFWDAGLFDGFTAVADFDKDSKPEVVLVGGGKLYVLNGETGERILGPHNIPGNGNGGSPTIADFDGDGELEVGVAMSNYYSMMKPDFSSMKVVNMWSTQNHDNSSSVTGSSVFDFEGDGKAEVVYMDECFVWVYDGLSGDVLFTANSQSFTATETPIVADVDADGHAELVVVHNGANPNVWTCSHHKGHDKYPAWNPPVAGNYQGVTVYGDAANSWVSTRTLWNQHSYSVSNICDPRDGACGDDSYYGQIPKVRKRNWELPWLNNFRQNVQDKAVHNAPDAIVSLEASCSEIVELSVRVRNAGLAVLPAGVSVRLFRSEDDFIVGEYVTQGALFPGQTEKGVVVTDPEEADMEDFFYAEIIVDPAVPLFKECRTENNRSRDVQAVCIF